MLAGVPRARINAGVKLPPTSAKARPSNKATHSAVPATALTRPVSRAPQACPIRIDHAAPRPMIKDTHNNATGKIPLSGVKSGRQTLSPIESHSLDAEHGVGEMATCDR